eukprot:CAMPEP_0174334196 /NCGR_PEP_ID=MMETSP0810-20121108/19737_1 /TAXON_ID=73025 ORGANISM="Eutreptiella gymnastica-like, Strain CCMP1594" /NCGR_SAMPLE_ID=MMETSP0810 /ASSEMBLY_ACC=CAM_ASM_000659 /LENGTH=174 /DNA_ID=CAMNT_0015451725 /DNA_START=192 /DNA_END=718 /DNA_ORIENTATION=+
MPLTTPRPATLRTTPFPLGCTGPLRRAEVASGETLRVAWGSLSACAFATALAPWDVTHAYCHLKKNGNQDEPRAQETKRTCHAGPVPPAGLPYMPPIAINAGMAGYQFSAEARSIARNAGGLRAPPQGSLCAPFLMGDGCPGGLLNVRLLAAADGFSDFQGFGSASVARDGVIQ